MSNDSESDEIEIIDLTELPDASDEEYEYNEHLEDSDGSENEEIHIDILSKHQLRQVILSVPEYRLRYTVSKLVDTIPAAELELLRELVTVSDGYPVSRWQRCSNCSADFDMSSPREPSECIFHSGSLLLEATGPGTNGGKSEIGGQENGDAATNVQEEWQWTCCKEGPSNKGCVLTAHEPSGINKKRKISELE